MGMDFSPLVLVVVVQCCYISWVWFQIACCCNGDQVIPNSMPYKLCRWVMFCIWA